MKVLLTIQAVTRTGVITFVNVIVNVDSWPVSEHDIYEIISDVNAKYHYSSSVILNMIPLAD